MPHLLAVVLKLTVDDPFPWTVQSSGPNPLAKIVPVKGRGKEIVVINDVRLQATLAVCVYVWVSKVNSK